MDTPAVEARLAAMEADVQSVRSDVQVIRALLQQQQQQQLHFSPSSSAFANSGGRPATTSGVHHPPACAPPPQTPALPRNASGTFAQQPPLAPTTPAIPPAMALATHTGAADQCPGSPRPLAASQCAASRWGTVMASIRHQMLDGGTATGSSPPSLPKHNGGCEGGAVEAHHRTSTDVPEDPMHDPFLASMREGVDLGASTLRRQPTLDLIVGHATPSKKQRPSTALGASGRGPQRTTAADVVGAGATTSRTLRGHVPSLSEVEPVLSGTVSPQLPHPHHRDAPQFPAEPTDEAGSPLLMSLNPGASHGAIPPSRSTTFVPFDIAETENGLDLLAPEEEGEEVTESQLPFAMQSFEAAGGRRRATGGGGSSAGGSAQDSPGVSVSSVSSSACLGAWQRSAQRRLFRCLTPFVLPIGARRSSVFDAVYVVCSAGSAGAALVPVHMYYADDTNKGTAVPGLLAGEFALIVLLFFVAQLLTVVWTTLRFIEPVRLAGDPWHVARTPATIFDEVVLQRPWLFTFDLFMAVPIEWIFAGWRWDIFFGLHIRHFLRVGRYATFGRSNDPLSPPRRQLRLFCLIVTLMLVIHCVACVFWAVEPDLNYEASLYWAITTLSTVGYGDIVPTASTRLFACFTMFLSMFMVAGLTSYGTWAMTRRDLRQDREESVRTHMHAMGRYYGLPPSVCERISGYFPSLLANEHEEQFRALINGLPDVERDRIAAYVHAKVLRPLEALEGLSEAAVLKLSSCVERRLYASGSFIFSQGDPGNEMFFLTRGRAEVLRVHPEMLAPLRIPCPRIFGEMALLEDCKRSGWVVATAPCEVLVLSRANFELHVRPHRELFAAIEAIANKRRIENRRRAEGQAEAFYATHPVIGQLGQPALEMLRLNSHSDLFEAGAMIYDSKAAAEAGGHSVFFIVTGFAEARGQAEEESRGGSAAQPELGEGHMPSSHHPPIVPRHHILKRGDAFGGLPPPPPADDDDANDEGGMLHGRTGAAAEVHHIVVLASSRLEVLILPWEQAEVLLRQWPLLRRWIVA